MKSSCFVAQVGSIISSQKKHRSKLFQLLEVEGRENPVCPIYSMPVWLKHLGFGCYLLANGA